jgi:hypothetical protein
VTSFTAKQLRVTFIMTGTNQVFPGTGNNTLVLTKLRMSAKVDAVARLATSLDLKVFGMKREDMNALTVAWANPPIVLNNIVIVEANNGNGWAQVFSGTIKEAQPIYRAQPDVYFQVIGITGYFQKINVAAPTTYPYQVDIGVVAGDIIEKMGFTYVDGGADGVLDTPYFYGSLWDQLSKACAAAKADFYMQGDNVLVVPQGKPRAGAPSVVLTPDSGLVGYPEYSGAGLEVTAIYDPAFSCGAPIDLTTSVPSATGRWFPIKLKHVLEPLLPRGQWLTYLQCLRVLV